MHAPVSDRRSFLASGAALVATSLARRSPAASADDGPTLGIQMNSLRGFPVDEALSIEYEENPKNPLAEIRACIEAARAAMAAA